MIDVLHYENHKFSTEFGSWSAVGTWYIPYQNISETTPTSAQYLHCGGAPQSAVTHAGANSGTFVISFQWRPPADLEGRVRIQATVVEDYRTYWTGILAPSVTVVPHKETPVQQIQYVNSDTLFGIGQTTTTTATRTNPMKQEKTTQETTRMTTKLTFQSTPTTERSTTTRRTTKPTTISTSTRKTTKSTSVETTTKGTTKSSTEAITSDSRTTRMATTSIAQEWQQHQ